MTLTPALIAFLAILNGTAPTAPVIVEAPQTVTPSALAQQPTDEADEPESISPPSMDGVTRQQF